MTIDNTRKWLDYYMNIAREVAKGSKDESSKVGCQIVTKDWLPVSSGFNGYVKGCDEKFMTQERPMKYHLTLHAEINAVHFAGRLQLHDCIAIVTHGPCDNCLLNLAQKGIREVYYDDPGIMRDRGSDVQLDAIKRIILSTDMRVLQYNTGNSYLSELGLE